MTKITDFKGLFFCALLTFVGVSAMAQEIKGKVYDRSTNESVEKGKVILLNHKKEKVVEQQISNDGTFRIESEELKANYYLQAEAPHYNSAEVTVKKSVDTDVFLVDIGLDKQSIAQQEEPKSKLIKTIYYDFDSSYLNQQNKDDLESVISFLRDHPEKKLLIQAHADSRGSNQYNDWLSERRVERAANWLVVRGRISRDRISTAFLGKRELKNDCDHGVKCTEAMHRLNRGAEFIILN